mgnify:CR=1 FL=1
MSHVRAARRHTHNAVSVVSASKAFSGIAVIRLPERSLRARDEATRQSSEAPCDVSQAAWRGVDARERAGHNRACESACRLEPRSLLQRRQPGACAPICESQNRATLGTHRVLALAGSVIGSFASEAMLFPLQ